MGQVSRLNRQRTQQLSPSLRAEEFDVGIKEGYSYVGIKFEQRLPNGGTREFRTDLEHLERVEKRVAEYAASGDTDERHERIGDVQLRMKRGFYPDRGDAVGVQLAQKARDGTGEVQRLGTYADSLKRTVNHGQELERELGYDQRWHVLVEANSLTKGENGRIQAQAVESFANETEARDRLGRSGGGLALSTEPQRREFKRGETVELWAGESMLVKGQRKTRSVEQQLGQAEWVQGRETEHFALARWDDKYNKPQMDARTRFDGTGYGSNLQPEDYKAGYNPSRERGEQGEPKWVLIEKDANKPGLGNIRGISGDRDALAGEMKRMEGHKQEVLQAVGKDWEKQSFGMDRNQYTQGHSM